MTITVQKLTQTHAMWQRFYLCTFFLLFTLFLYLLVDTATSQLFFFKCLSLVSQTKPFFFFFSVPPLFAALQPYRTQTWQFFLSLLTPLLLTSWLAEQSCALMLACPFEGMQGQHHIHLCKCSLYLSKEMSAWNSENVHVPNWISVL